MPPPCAPFPAHVLPDFSFGLVLDKGERAGTLVSPPKSWPQVDAEAAVGRELYLASHKSYSPGEQVSRNYYNVSPDGFDANRVYGMPTPMDIRGTAAARSLRWVHEDRKRLATPLGSKRVEEFKERTQPQLGLNLDPYALSFGYYLPTTPLVIIFETLQLFIFT